MSLSAFFSALMEHGRVLAQPPGPLTEADRQDSLPLVQEMDRLWRLDAPGTAPPLDVKAATWAGERIYLACRFVAFRDAGPEAMDAAFANVTKADSDAPGDLNQAAIHYSVDLAMRFLPELYRLAAAASKADPLLGHLRRMGQAWPLSSVGMPEMGAVDVAPITADACLTAIYVDRILQRKDISRLGDAATCAAIRCALGLHTSLAPEIWSAMEKLAAPAGALPAPPPTAVT